MHIFTVSIQFVVNYCHNHANENEITSPLHNLINYISLIKYVYTFLFIARISALPTFGVGVARAALFLLQCSGLH